MPRQSFFANCGPLTLAELAAATRARAADGTDTSLSVSDVAPVSDCGPDEITFVANARYFRDLARLDRGLCLISEANAARVPAGTIALVTPFPEAAFARAIAAFYPDAASGWSSSGASPAAPVDPGARLEDGVVLEAGVVIGPDVEIGARTRIAANTVIGANVRIGRGCAIGPGVSIMHALIGNDVIIHPGVRIGQDGFGYAEGPDSLVKLPQIGRVIVQNGVEIGANSTIDRGMLQDTVIGEGTKIDNLVQIAHNAAVGRSCAIAAQSGISGSVQVGDGAMFGGQAGTVPHIRIGSGAMVAGGTGVWCDVDDGARVAGRPHRTMDMFLRETAALGRLARRKEKGPGGST